MSFLVLPPEVNSALMFAGAGSGPTLAAAAAWDGLAAELGQAANSFSSATAALADTAWQGPAATAMAAAAAPYASWLSTAATRALSAAAQAKAAAAVYEAARAATVDPLLVAANRHQLVSLVLSNLFGQNAPAIAATEAAYEQLWAADVAAMVSYHSGASAVAAQLAPWAQAVRALPNPTAPALASGPAALAIPALGIGNTGIGNIFSIGNIGDYNLPKATLNGYRRPTWTMANHASIDTTTPRKSCANPTTTNHIDTQQRRRCRSHHRITEADANRPVGTAGTRAADRRGDKLLPVDEHDTLVTGEHGLDFFAIGRRC